jgi:uncharacterized protein YcbX
MGAIVGSTPGHNAGPARDPEPEPTRERCRLHPVRAGRAPDQVLRRPRAAPRPCWWRPGSTSTAPGWWSTSTARCSPSANGRALALVQPHAQAQRAAAARPGHAGLHLRWTRWRPPPACGSGTTWSRPYDMGALAAQWFSDFLGTPARLVRFDPETRAVRAPLDRRAQAENAFSDGFPLLVANQARWTTSTPPGRQGVMPPVTMQRFRPNLVLSGPAALRRRPHRRTGGRHRRRPGAAALVKPCVRCSIPNVDPASAPSPASRARTLAASGPTRACKAASPSA